jgi:predicted RNA-binding protein with RPS1 domain
LQNVRRAFEAEYKPKIAETTALKSQVLELQKQRRESLSIAQIACGKVGKADAERREATAQLIELKTKHNRLLASVAQESEKTKKLFEVEQKARKALEDEKITMQNELTQLRVFRAQFLQLTSPLKGVNKSA